MVFGVLFLFKLSAGASVLVFGCSLVGATEDPACPLAFSTAVSPEAFVSKLRLLLY